MTLLVPVVLALLQLGITQIRTNAKKEAELKTLIDKEKQRLKEELKS
jgi:cytochrome c-type biogenesis protein CcmH/NrfF